MKFVLAAVLLAAIFTDRSQGFMGWFGNGGKRPSGRRSLIEVFVANLHLRSC